MPQSQVLQGPLMRNTIQGNSRPPAINPGFLANRKDRHDNRADRRRGDWWILDVAAPLLWLENECILTTGDPMACAAEPMINLWP